MEILPVSSSNSTAVGDSLNLPDHRIHKDGDGDASFQLKLDSLPHAHAQTTKTFYKHQDLRIMKAQELKDKYFRTNSDIQDLPSKISSLSREIVRCFSRMMQKSRMEKAKSKDNDKGSRSKIKKHEGTSLQRRQRLRSQEHNDKSNLIDLTKECHNELTSGEIVSLKILSQTMEVRSRNVGSHRKLQQCESSIFKYQENLFRCFGQFISHDGVNVVGARETVGGPVVQQSGIQCFNYKEFGHYAKEYRKPKWVKDSTYHKEKMLLCKQAEKGVQLQAEQSDWLADTDEEIDEQELEAHYSYIAKIQEVPNADSGTDAEPLEQVQYDTDDNVFANDIQHFDQSESISNTSVVETGDSNVTPDSPDMCDNDILDDQNDVECDDERVALANLIANLKLDVDENKKIQNQLKKANATLTQY
ncbi:hypothetical protein Tco_1002839 [Tanacetum coccineum]|uniref:Uncharacterized protein n=1 Tax=Tanacetum coccineum TaxID=301880 RepID=A0ABQ5F7I4_9ASTR